MKNLYNLHKAVQFDLICSRLEKKRINMESLWKDLT